MLANILDFATYNNLVLANSLGNHKPSGRWTCHNPEGTHHNQTDYILLKKRFRSGIKTSRTRTFPGADVGSNHDTLMMTFQTRLKNSRKPTQSRIRFQGGTSVVVPCCSCCLCLYFGSAIMLVTYFVNFR